MLLTSSMYPKMILNLSKIPLFTLLSISFFIITIPISSSPQSTTGCHAPDVRWLYPDNGYNLSGIVTLYWTEANTERGEEIGYSLYVDSSESGLTVISNSIGYVNFNLDTTKIPNGEVTLIIESYDGYKARNDSIIVNVDQMLETTPFNVSMLQKYECTFELLSITSLKESQPSIMNVPGVLVTTIIAFGLLTHFKRSE